MSLIATEEELLRCFREIDRHEVELAPDVALPLDVDDVAAWAVGPRAFLVFRDRPGARPRGIVFHRNSGSAPDVAAMCEWCHAVRGHGGVKLLSVRTDERRRVGLYLCSDLGCVGRARQLPGPDDIPERLDGAERARR
ncbi:MAG TPA: FBP domain-containing protein, partial [Polyangia bacterium]